MPQDDIEVSVAESRIDIGIVFSKPFAATARPNELETAVLFEEKLCVAVGKTHPRAKQRERICPGTRINCYGKKGWQL